MITIKILTILEVLVFIAVTISENGFVKLIGLAVLVFLGMLIASKLEKYYGLDN